MRRGGKVAVARTPPQHLLWELAPTFFHRDLSRQGGAEQGGERWNYQGPSGEEVRPLDTIQGRIREIESPTHHQKSQPVQAQEWSGKSFLNTSFSPDVSDYVFPLQRQPEDSGLNQKGYFSSFIGEDISTFEFWRSIFRKRIGFWDWGKAG